MIKKPTDKMMDKLLKSNNIEEYLKENEKYFDLMPGIEAATIRPAVVARGGLLRKGLASTGK